MKKFLLFVLAFSLVSFNVAGATEGFYAGGSIAINKSKVKFDDEGDDNNVKSTKPTIALDLGYKFNFNGFTVAPELSVNLLGKTVKKKSTVGDVTTKYTQTELGSLNVKLGYDVTEELNTFVLAGVSMLKKLEAKDDDGKDTYKMKQPIYNLGLGAEYIVVDNLGVNLTFVSTFGKSKKKVDEDGVETKFKYTNFKFALGANYYFGF